MPRVAERGSMVDDRYAAARERIEDGVARGRVSGWHQAVHRAHVRGIHGRLLTRVRLTRAIMRNARAIGLPASPHKRCAIHAVALESGKDASARRTPGTPRRALATVVPQLI